MGSLYVDGRRDEPIDDANFRDGLPPSRLTMDDKSEQITISGIATPYRSDGEITPLAEITIRQGRLGVVVTGRKGEKFRSGCDIWEHTIHELETLSAALRTAAAGPLPPLCRVPAKESLIGDYLNLHPSIDIELGYSLEEPGAPRARLFCSSKRVGHGDELAVWLAVATQGAFAEVVLDTSQATETADWVDLHIKRLNRLLEG